MKQRVSILFLTMCVLHYGANALTIRAQYNDESDRFSSLSVLHRTADFGRAPYSYGQISIPVVIDNLCTERSHVIPKSIIVTQRGCDVFTAMVSKGQQLGASVVVVANNDAIRSNDIIEMKGWSFEPITIAAVAISYSAHQRIIDFIARHASADNVVMSVDSDGEIATPPFTGGVRTGGDVYASTGGDVYVPTGGDVYVPPYTVVPPPTDQTGYWYQPEPDFDNATDDHFLNIFWLIVGAILMIKCTIITVACRRRYRASRCTSNTSSSSSSACARRCQRRCGGRGNGNSSASVSLLSSSSSSSSEGDVPAAVYATYPMPSSAFSVQNGDVENGMSGVEDDIVTEATVTPAVVAAGTDSTPAASSPASPRPLTASALSVYPSIQYAPLMPQATAPSGVYDLERQPIVIRG